MFSDRAQRVALALGALRSQGTRGYIGEPVSQLEHALQAAALAVQAKATGAQVLAALFHDTGHLIAPLGAAETRVSTIRRPGRCISRACEELNYSNA